MSHYHLHSHNKILYLINKIIKPLPIRVKEKWEMQITCNTIIIVIRQWKWTMRRSFLRLICCMNRSGGWQRKHYCACRGTDHKITDITINILHRTQKNSIRNSKQDRMSCERKPPGIINSKEEDIDMNFVITRMGLKMGRLSLSPTWKSQLFNMNPGFPIVPHKAEYVSIVCKNPGAESNSHNKFRNSALFFCL